jgi:hypothetical protein
MNDKILELMKVKGRVEEIANQIMAFADEHGPKALKQLERVVKQGERYNQFMDIIDHDRGFDPRRGEEVNIREIATQLKSYDQELQNIIELSKHGPVLRCIEDCLWLYIDRDRSKCREEKVANFARELNNTSPSSLQWFSEHFGAKEPFEPVVLEGNLICPEAIPLFLRQLDPETVRDVLIGKLMFSVFLFVDWHNLGRVFADLGSELRWSSVKEGRSERAKPKWRQMLTIGDRIPRIHLTNGHYIEGLSKIYRVLFDGITPRSIAAQYVEVLKSSDTPSSEAAPG